MAFNIKSLLFARHCFAINMFLIFCNLIWTSHHLLGMTKTNTNLDPQTTANTIITLTPPIKSHPFRPLLVTITNNGFVNLTKNWLVSLQKHNITDSLVLCGDIDCYNSLINFNSTINVQLVNNEILSRKQFFKFGSKVYKKMVNARSGIMHSLFMDLYMHNNSIYDGILFMDSDIVITNNFIPLIENKYLYHNKTTQIMNDLIVVKDVKDFECIATSDGPYCGCMLLLPFHKRDIDIKIHKKKMEFFFNKWWNTTHRRNGNSNGDQQPMNRAIRRMRVPFKKMGYPLKLGVLNCTEFPSGWSMQNDLWVNMYWNNILNRTVQSVHANFVTGYDAKVALLNKYNLWYI